MTAQARNNKGFGMVESFKTHDERMKIFRRNHPFIPEPVVANAGGKRNIASENEWSALVPYRSVTVRRFSPN
jgi:hypothetical protein